MQRVLVVDDDPFVREMITMILEASDYEVIAVGSGEEALKKLAGEDKIALILSDMNMPQMSGLELMKEVHAQKPELPFIILTGGEDPIIHTQAISTGARGCVVKNQEIEETIPMAVGKILQA